MRTPMNNEEPSKEEEGTTKIVLEALEKMNESFGAGVKKKSRVISTGFTLNEIVKDER